MTHCHTVIHAPKQVTSRRRVETLLFGPTGPGPGTSLHARPTSASACSCGWCMRLPPKLASKLTPKLARAPPAKDSGELWAEAGRPLRVAVGSEVQQVIH